MAGFLRFALARLEIELSLDEEFFWQRIDPQFASQFDGKDVALDLDFHLEGPPVDPWFKSDEGVQKLLLYFFNIRRQASVQLADPEVNNGMKGFFKIAKGHRADPFIRKMTNGVEEPIQITKYSRLVALEGNNPLAATLLSFSRFVVCKTIEQTGLEFVERSESFGHNQRTSTFFFRGKNRRQQKNALKGDQILAQGFNPGPANLMRCALNGRQSSACHIESKSFMSSSSLSCHFQGAFLGGGYPGLKPWAEIRSPFSGERHGCFLKVDAQTIAFGVARNAPPRFLPIRP